MLKLAVVTDGGALGPTALAVWSALTHTPGPVEVVFLGIGIAPDALARIGRMVTRFPAACLTHIDLSEDLLGDRLPPGSHISKATFGRLQLHRLVAGRVLYMDGDVLVTGDLSPLAELDLRGAPVAAAPDFAAQQSCVRATSRFRRDRGMRTDRYAEVAGDPRRYFNAGVMLMDLDAIRARPDLAAAIEDVGAAAGYRLADQDHLNHTLAGETLLLDPAWNCSWGRLRRQRRFLDQLGLTAERAGAAEARILHFHGPWKPWRPIPWRRLPRYGRGAWIWRKALATFRKQEPELAALI